MRLYHKFTDISSVQPLSRHSWILPRILESSQSEMLNNNNGTNMTTTDVINTNVWNQHVGLYYHWLPSLLKFYIPKLLLSSVHAAQYGWWGRPKTCIRHRWWYLTIKQVVFNKMSNEFLHFRESSNANTNQLLYTTSDSFIHSQACICSLHHKTTAERTPGYS